ncbi:MAG: bifunctional methylenetetrahydrofolate dehydrogenase/methenyltetrahydrofolate cyclohydrolase FolD [Firmicutes bacterium]|nr:bifunctional methylenetetrahydrofolate dehydrogenase/methenyltetrahydrofolate cyclohydrolase FolD [Bacillota bacterium]
MAKVICGKTLAQRVREGLKVEAREFEKANKRRVGLAVVLVGENPASQVYVRNKAKACEDVGIRSFTHILDENSKKEDVIKVIKKLNQDARVDGILVQLPLPKHLDEREILAFVKPKKDVDGFHTENAGALLLGHGTLVACTPLGIIELIKETGEDMCGKHAVVIGRSNIVGKPVAHLLLQNDCTVTVCHSRTKDLAHYTKQADILVAAIGKKEFVRGDMVKSGAIVIDVGINRDSDKLYGDVCFDEVKDVAWYITPVPGGVGPMTIAMLLSNVIKAAQKR